MASVSEIYIFSPNLILTLQSSSFEYQFCAISIRKKFRFCILLIDRPLLFDKVINKYHDKLIIHVSRFIDNSFDITWRQNYICCSPVYKFTMKKTVQHIHENRPRISLPLPRIRAQHVWDRRGTIIHASHMRAKYSQNAIKISIG